MAFLAALVPEILAVGGEAAAAGGGAAAAGGAAARGASALGRVGQLAKAMPPSGGGESRTQSFSQGSGGDIFSSIKHD